MIQNGGRSIAVALSRGRKQRLDDQGMTKDHRLKVPTLVLYSFTDNPPPLYLPIKYDDDDNRFNARLDNLSFGYSVKPNPQKEMVNINSTKKHYYVH
ncbi:predicted protein [Lichtheimia corymbifera JMRC:FSU:9682]|uniref:Uncharacterized protein n=1 Tax=Lichtheimia corymbifera JMRC:FSU:9682 TaxID=1263082 RepID=A0A068S9K2_9FUNG|nr:predicted protein [Lichtheimia corymbifera JMRC:FSU:9682]